MADGVAEAGAPAASAPCHAGDLERAGRILAILSAGARDAFRRIHLLEEVDSTNRWLMDRPGDEGAAVCIAARQSAGRGRRGRAWVSPTGGNVYFSARWQFGCMGPALAGLGLVAGVVAAEAIAARGIGGVGLKWPNDLVCDVGKLGGVLLESRSSAGAGGGATVVIGIGINVALPDAMKAGLDQPAADLVSLAGAPVDADTLIAALMEGLAAALPHFEAQGLAPFRERWRALDRLDGRVVTVREAGGEWEGVALGIDTDGALRVRTAAGEERVHAADVSVRARP
jgi:BirA family biotin operon repressor/biotin-[acetyl-CoA-carboxylase] ligase